MILHLDRWKPALTFSQAKRTFEIPGHKQLHVLPVVSLSNSCLRPRSPPSLTEKREGFFFKKKEE